MDENKNAEVGDCVQISGKVGMGYGQTGRIIEIFEGKYGKVANVRIDDGILVRRKLKDLIPRHTMACDELF